MASVVALVAAEVGSEAVMAPEETVMALAGQADRPPDPEDLKGGMETEISNREAAVDVRTMTDPAADSGIGALVTVTVAAGLEETWSRLAGAKAADIANVTETGTETATTVTTVIEIGTETGIVTARGIGIAETTIVREMTTTANEATKGVVTKTRASCGGTEHRVMRYVKGWCAWLVDVVSSVGHMRARAVTNWTWLLKALSCHRVR